MCKWASLPGVQHLGLGVDHPHPSTTVVRERVQLYLCSPSGPSRRVLGYNLHLSLYLLRDLIIIGGCNNYDGQTSMLKAYENECISEEGKLGFFTCIFTKTDLTN
jgi:hypothetical protein